jgi:hypothetical protein
VTQRNSSIVGKHGFRKAETLYKPARDGNEDLAGHSGIAKKGGYNGRNLLPGQSVQHISGNTVGIR